MQLSAKSMLCAFDIGAGRSCIKKAKAARPVWLDGIRIPHILQGSCNTHKPKVQAAPANALLHYRAHNAFKQHMLERRRGAGVCMRMPQQQGHGCPTTPTSHHTTSHHASGPRTHWYQHRQLSGGAS